MGSLNRKEVLLKKYWDGESTLKEEQELKGLLTPEDGALHQFFQSAEDLKSNSVDIDIRSLISDTEEPQARIINLRSAYRILSYAAVVLVLILTTTWMINRDADPEVLAQQETFDNPELALEQTKEALAFVFNKMNKGQNTTLSNVKRVESLDDIIPN